MTPRPLQPQIFPARYARGGALRASALRAEGTAHVSSLTTIPARLTYYLLFFFATVVGKSAQLAMFGVTARGHLKSGQTAHSHRSGQVSPAIAHVCTGRSLQCGRVRGARASKTRKGGVKQRTVEFLGGQTRFFGFPVCYLGQNHRSSHLPGEDRMRPRVEKTQVDGRQLTELLFL